HNIHVLKTRTLTIHVSDTCFFPGIHKSTHMFDTNIGVYSKPFTNISNYITVVPFHRYTTPLRAIRYKSSWQFKTTRSVQQPT
ncbi:hypothetical protein ACJX0J_006977, partial [Zea mays]